MNINLHADNMLMHKNRLRRGLLSETIRVRVDNNARVHPGKRIMYVIENSRYQGSAVVSNTTLGIALVVSMRYHRHSRDFLVGILTAEGFLEVSLFDDFQLIVFL